MATEDEKIEDQNLTEGEAPEETGQGAESEEKVDEPKMYDEAYVKQLREENASWRKRLRDTEEKLAAAKSPEDYEELQKTLAEVQAKYERDQLVAKVTKDLPLDLVEATSWPQDEEGIKHLADVLRKHVVVRKESSEELHGGLDPRNDRLEDNASPAELAARYNKRVRH